MNTILNKIFELRKGVTFDIDNKNSNRYRVVADEPNGSKTGYYFSTPIYNNKTRKTVDLKFYPKDNMAYAIGSNANITISESIKMENDKGRCTILLNHSAEKISDCQILCGNDLIYPTTNGIAIKSSCRNGTTLAFSLEINKPFLEVRANDKYFALMGERFRPFVSISCIGTLDATENIISPARITSQKITDKKYIITVSPCSLLGESILVEANLYEAKLFQDTTVESKNPKTNNAFGSIGFIGNTKDFGEQWLYTRMNFDNLSDLNNNKILRAILHLPKLNSNAVELAASNVVARFCSFGSTWNNKIAESLPFANSQITDKYIDIDLTSVLADKYGKLKRDEGFILKAKKKCSGVSVIATGDNYLFPQILEINYL